MILSFIKKIFSWFISYFQHQHKTKSLEDDLTISKTSFTIEQKLVPSSSKEEKYIIVKNKKISIKWDKVVLYTDKNGYKIDNNNYRIRESGKPTMFVVHWDACLSTKSMVNVLKERGLSVQFGIDNDGTIYQLMDANNIAWHAKGVNSTSCGVEIANAVDMKFSEWYPKNGFEKRPIMKNVIVHNKEMQPHLGFYQIQIEALKALIDAVSRACNIPLAVPTDSSGKLIRGVDSRVIKGVYRGIVGHYHVTSNKTDPASLDFEKLIYDIRKDF
jgi:N-acetylmuramoyl-L-alanine amidase